MKLENKKIEIFTLIIVVCSIVAFICIPQMELKIVVGAVIGIALIILLSQIVNKQRYNIKSRNYNIKPSDDIMVKGIRDTQANRSTIVNDGEKETFDNSSFVVVNLAEADLNNKNSATPSKQLYTYSGDFDTEDSINTPNKINKQTEITEDNYDVVVQSNNQEAQIDNVDMNIVDEQKENLFDVSNIENKTVSIPTEVDVVASPIKVETKNIPTSASNVSASDIKGADSIQQQIKKELENKYTEPFQKLDITLPIRHIVDMDIKLETKREEFLYFIEQFFVIIRSVFDANTLAFVWVNHITKTLDFRLLSSEIDTKDALITKQQKIQFGNDIISQIVEEKYPQIISQLYNSNAELDFFSYYTKPVGTNSFIGIPIFFENTVIAVLCADSKKVNAFSKQEYAFLGCFAKVISRLVNNFDTTSRQENSEKILELLGNFNKLIAHNGSNFNEICNSITEYILSIYSCSSIGIVSYNDTAKNWAVLSYKTIEDVDKEFVNENINLKNTIIGECIIRNQTIPLANIPSEFTRVNKYEPSINNGSFVAIPICSTTDVYGALFIEYKDNPIFATTIDLNILETICQQAGEMLEKIRLTQLYSKYVATEIKTGILTETSLKSRILEEFNKAQDTNSKLTFALVSLDKYAALEDIKKKTMIFNKIIEVIRSNIKNYEIIGRINSDVLGIILFNRNTSQSKPIFEKIRQQLATRYFDFDNEKLAFTISVGLAHTNPKNSFDEFVSNVTVALRKAEEHTNYVQVFE